MCPGVDSKGIQQRMHAGNSFSTLLRLRKWYVHEPEGFMRVKGVLGDCWVLWIWMRIGSGVCVCSVVSDYLRPCGL